MPAIPIIGAVGAIGGLALGAAGLSAQKKAANAAAEAAKNAKVDIPAVIDQAHNQAIKNAYDSAALEKELNPLAPQLRNQSLQAVIQQMQGSKYDDAIQSSLYNDFNSQSSAPQFQNYGQSELSQQAQQKALQDLALGGKLDQETANQVIRSSAAKAGTVSGGGLGLGRDISARDLGLTSLQLAQQRLQTAQGFGQAQDAFTAQHANAQNNYGLSAYQLALQQQAQRANLGYGIASLGAQQYQRALSAAQLGQSIAQPVTGLDPSSIANLAVGNSNMQANAQQNAASMSAQAGSGLSSFGGQLMGVGLSAAAGYRPQSVSSGVPQSMATGGAGYKSPFLVPTIGPTWGGK